MLSIAEPELIKSILVKDFHIFSERRKLPIIHPIIKKSIFLLETQDWKRCRSIISPTFSSAKMRKLSPIVRNCLNNYLNHLQSLAEQKSNIDLK